MLSDLITSLVLLIEVTQYDTAKKSLGRRFKLGFEVQIQIPTLLRRHLWRTLSILRPNILGEEKPEIDILNPDLYKPAFGGTVMKCFSPMAAFHHRFTSICLSSLPVWSLGLHRHKENRTNVLCTSGWTGDT